MESSTREAAFGLDGELVKGYPQNEDLGGAQPIGSALPSTDECFGFETFYNGHGFPGVRHSLDMAWLTSMPMATGLDESGNIDGTFEW